MPCGYTYFLSTCLQIALYTFITKTIVCFFFIPSASADTLKKVRQEFIPELQVVVVVVVVVIAHPHSLSI